MTARVLRETTSTAPVKKDVGRFSVFVARPGQGSSGYYSEEILREYGPAALAPGAQSFIGHDDDRNIKDLIGVFPEGARWDDEAKALVAELQVFEHWRPFVEEVFPHVGVSIYMLGEADEDGNVTALIPDPSNGADLVHRPGLAGSGIAEKLYESARRADEEKPGVEAAQERKETMDDELKEMLKGISDALALLVAEKTQKEAAEAQIEADEAAIADAVEAYDAARKAVEDADLLEPQRDALLAAAKEGKDITADIETAKKIKEAAVKAASEQEETPVGRRLGESLKNVTDLGKVFG